MKIIISPSKRQNREEFTNDEPSGILNLDLTKQLFEGLKDYSRTELSKLMKIKNALLDDTYELFQKHHCNSPTKDAIKLYQGVAFEQIEVDKYNSLQKQYLNNHLIILSAMYGAIKPNSVIYPYRLDMMIKLKNINLYDYWESDIHELFSDEDLIVNLASNEFSKMLKQFKSKMVHIDFKEEDEKGKLRNISYNAKKARGEMVNQFVLNQITNIESIKALNINNYVFNQAKSNIKHLVFIKPYK